MLIWLLKDSEPVPMPNSDIRLQRIGVLANILASHGHKIVWWTSNFDHYKKEFFTQEKNLNVSDNYKIVPISSIGYKKNISFRRLLHCFLLAKRFAKLAKNEPKPDLILSCLPTIDFAYEAVRYGKENDIPVVLDLRDMWPDIMLDLIPNYLRIFGKIFILPLLRRVQYATKGASGLVGITEDFLSWGLQYAGRNKSLNDAVFPLAYTKMNPSQGELDSAADFYKKFGISKSFKGFIIILITSIRPSLQLTHVLDCIKKFSGDVKLIVAGQGEMLSQYKEKASDNPNIIFTGYINRGQIFKLLQFGHVGLVPYILRKDFLASISNKAIEYLSQGLPVITNLPETSVLGKKILENKCGFCYDQNNISTLVEVIKKLKNNKQLLATMSHNAKNLYEREFIAEKIYGDMCNYLEKIAKRV